MIDTQAIAAFHCPRWRELPSIGLYMDQVLLVLNETLAPLCSDGEAATSTMINNYVKQKLLPPPERKKYGRRQLALLLIICTLKRVLSISEIALLLSLSQETADDVRYDTFCEELERTLSYGLTSGFTGQNDPPMQRPRAALRAALIAFTGRLAFCVLMQNGAEPPAP